MKHDNNKLFVVFLLSGDQSCTYLLKIKPGESDKCLHNLCISAAWHRSNGGDFEMVSKVWAPAELCPSKTHGHLN